jgi:hypothetical protein
VRSKSTLSEALPCSRSEVRTPDYADSKSRRAFCDQLAVLAANFPWPMVVSRGSLMCFCSFDLHGGVLFNDVSVDT